MNDWTFVYDNIDVFLHKCNSKVAHVKCYYKSRKDSDISGSQHPESSAYNTYSLMDATLK